MMTNKKKTYMVQELIHYGRLAQESQTDGAFIRESRANVMFRIVRKINF